MRLVDASAWVHFLRRKGDPQVKARVTQLLRDDEASHTCPTWFEILSGAKKEEEGDAREVFGISRHIRFQPDDWEAAAILDRDARGRGLIIPRNDLFVAVVAVREQATVLCRDNHFNALRDTVVSRLKVEQV